MHHVTPPHTHTHTPNIQLDAPCDHIHSQCLPINKFQLPFPLHQSRQGREQENSLLVMSWHRHSVCVCVCVLVCVCVRERDKVKTTQTERNRVCTCLHFLLVWLLSFKLGDIQ